MVDAGDNQSLLLVQNTVHGILVDCGVDLSLGGNGPCLHDGQISRRILIDCDSYIYIEERTCIRMYTPLHIHMSAQIMIRSTCMCDLVPTGRRFKDD